MQKAVITLVLAFSFFKLQAQSELAKYPLYTLNKNASNHLVFYISGDGGWNSFSKKLCEELSQKGYAVVCLDSRKYFWEQKTPEKLALDVSEILEYYLKAWGKEEFSLIGYSFGADAAAFIPSRISKNLLSKLKSNILLIPSVSTSFEIKMSDMMGFGTKEGKYKVLPEINKISTPVLCLFAKDEDSSLFPLIKEKANLKKISLPGSHKFDNDIKALVQVILTAL